MTDTRTRELERRARESGAPDDWAAYIESNRLGDEYVRDLCYALLAENSDGAKRPALKSLVQRGGIWLEQDEEQLIIHGAQHQGKGDETRQPYRLSWQRERSRWSAEQHASLLPIARFTYGEIPTLLELDATVCATEHARQVGRQPELVQLVERMIQEDITSGVLTSDRLNYGKHRVRKLTRAYGRRDQEEIAVNFFTGYGLIDEDMARTLFSARESLPRIGARYNRLLGTQHGIWRHFMPPVSETGERIHEGVIVLHRRIMPNSQISVLSIIGDDLTLYRPLRLLHTDKIQ